MKMKGLLAKKEGMTSFITEDGNVFGVTVLSAGPCVVTQKKTKARDGYDALQIGFLDKSEKKSIKAETGHAKKNNMSVKKHYKEIRLDKEIAIGEGYEIKVDIFKPGDKIIVSGISKGKGFQGTMKRHNFSGGNKTHGSKHHRLPGSIGGHTFPAKVWKNLKMSGHMGSDEISNKNLKVMKVDAEKNLIFVNGSVPGGTGTVVFLRSFSEFEVKA
jgi:large subunit ribosomal protein L3